MLQLPPSTLPHAACRGMVTDIFFPGGGNGYKKAKTICNGGPDTDACPDRAACLDLVLSFEVPGSGQRCGVWGGMTAHERDRKFGKVDDSVWKVLDLDGSTDVQASELLECQEQAS